MGASECVNSSESQNMVAVISAVITSGDWLAAAASRSLTSELLVRSISAGIVTIACRPDQRMSRSCAVPASAIP